MTQSAAGSRRYPFSADDRGLSTLEYLLLFSLIVVGALTLWTQLGASFGGQLDQGTSAFSAVLGGALHSSADPPSGADLTALQGAPQRWQPQTDPPGRRSAADGLAAASPSASGHASGTLPGPRPEPDGWLARPLGTGGKVAVVAGGAAAGVVIGAGMTWGTAYVASLACGPAALVCAGGVTVALAGVGIHQLANGGWDTLKGAFGRVFSSRDASVSDALTVGTTLGALAYGVTGGFGRGAAIARHGAQAGTATREAIASGLGRLFGRGSPPTATSPPATSGGTSTTAVAPGANAASSPKGLLSREYAEAVARTTGKSVDEVEAFYAAELGKGIDHRPLIASAMKNHGLTRAEAEAIYGYTCKQWYRGFNSQLESGNTHATEELMTLLKSGLSKMPSSSATTQYRGLRLDPGQLSKFDSEFALNKTVEVKSFWSTGPSPNSAYSGTRNLIIRTTRAKDISDLAFGKHFHGQIGKPVYDAETLIPPGTRFRVADVDNGTVVLEEIP